MEGIVRPAWALPCHPGPGGSPFSGRRLTVGESLGSPGRGCQSECTSHAPGCLIKEGLAAFQRAITPYLGETERVSS